MRNHVAYDDLGITVWVETPKPSLRARLGRLIALPFAALAEAVRSRRALQDVARLTDRELADIGAPPELIARISASRPRGPMPGDGWC